MPGERIEQADEARLVRSGEKTHQAFGFIVKNVDTFRRRMGRGRENGEWDQVLRRDRIRVRLRDVAAGALVARVRVFGNELGEAFVEPARNAVGVETVKNEMHYFVTERIVAEAVG